MTAPSPLVSLLTPVGTGTSTGVRGLLLQYLPPEDRAALELAVTPFPADPAERRQRLKAWVDSTFVQKLVQGMMRGEHGHAYEHHCVETFPTGLNAGAVLTALAKHGKDKDRNKGVLTRVQAAITNRAKKPIAGSAPAELVLRARVVGVDPETLALPDEPRRCTSCAFIARHHVEAAAGWMARAFSAYHRLGHRRESLTLTHRGNAVAFTWDPRQGGYKVVAPLAAVSADVVLTLVGYESTLTFAAIAGTVNVLMGGMKGVPATEVLNALLQFATEKVTSFEGGQIVAVFKEGDAGPYIYSLYPSPASPHDRSRK